MEEPSIYWTNKIPQQITSDHSLSSNPEKDMASKKNTFCFYNYCSLMGYVFYEYKKVANRSGVILHPNNGLQTT